MRSLLALCGLTLLTAVVPVHAGEWVYFKNGHKMLVESMREEEGIIYLKLSAGNEVGFPKGLLAEVSRTSEQRMTKQYGAHTSSGRGPGFDQLFGTQEVLAQMGTAQRSAALESQAMRSGTTYSYGYSYLDSQDVTSIQRKTPTASPQELRRNLNAIDMDSMLATDTVSDRVGANANQRPFGLQTVPRNRDKRRGNID